MERLYLPLDGWVDMEDASFDAMADAGWGVATGDEFLRQLNAKLQGQEVTRAAWVAARRAGMEPTEEVLAVAREVKRSGRSRLVLLTNNNPLLREEIGALFPEVAELFAPHAWASSQFGTAKPDLLVWERVALTLGVRPSELYFVDDSPENIVAANEAGLLGAFHFDGGVSAAAPLASSFEAGEASKKRLHSAAEATCTSCGGLWWGLGRWLTGLGMTRSVARRWRPRVSCSSS
eukprot:COSAG04_NODE_1306_length_7295_cov_3.324208_11_plen_234_part_00